MTYTVRDVTFASDSGDTRTAVSYKMDVPDTTTTAQVEAIFDDIVQDAESNTLVPNYIVIASTVQLGSCKLTMYVFVCNTSRICYSMHATCSSNKYHKLLVYDDWQIGSLGRLQSRCTCNGASTPKSKCSDEF